MRLFELGKGNTISSSAEFPVLYHLCDYIGFAYALEHDALRSHGSYYVSTTWNEDMNSVAAKPFSVFKLVLDGSMIDRYGAFHFDDYALELGSNGRRKAVSHGEDEIGIDTREIAPLSDFHKGTVLMFNLFSESGLQWLLYRNAGHDDGFMRRATAPTRQAIETIHYHLFELRKPLWKKKVGMGLSKEEMQFLDEVYRLRDLPFTKALEEITKKFPMVDHWSKPLDHETAVRRHMAPKAVKLLNSYMAGKYVKDIDINVVRTIIQRIIGMLGLGHNAETVIMHEIEASGLMHPMTAPVEWGGVITSAMDGDIDETLETIRWFAEREKKRREWWDKAQADDHIRQYAVHDGTQFGRMNEGFETAKGSTYQVNDDGTTTRNKAYRPEHGEAEQGPQPRSERTFYVAADLVEPLGLIQTRGGKGAMAIVLDSESDRAAIRYVTGPDAGKLVKGTVVPIERTPRIGMIPVELWNGGRRAHFGNPIVKMD